jgi:lipopolysaccharide transport system ATP-binding protein
MNHVVIQVDQLSKQYRLGTIGGRRLVDDVSRWWAKLGRKEDPLSKVGTPPASGERLPKPETIWALKDVSFEVKRGQVLGIIGQNGAGKSTLLKILSRVAAPTSGEARVKGRIASLLEVGTGFHPELTGRENIYLNGAILGMTKAEIRTKFDEIVAFSEVEQFIDTPVKRYSSGMYVRLAFAVAAHLEPEILIVDEVLAVGDAEFQKKCLGKMQDVAGNGRTVLFVSHNMAAVQNLCSQGLVLTAGGLAFHGPVSEAIDCYLGPSSETSSGTGTDKVQGRRPSWAKPYIVDARLLDGNGNETRAFNLGSGLVVEMSVNCPPGATLRRPVMGLVLNHSRFGAVGGVNMRMTGHDNYRNSHEKLKLRCQLQDLPFLQGDYSLDLWLGDGRIDVDSLEGALRFNLRPTDVYGSGKLPFEHLGVVFLKAEWGIHPEN